MNLDQLQNKLLAAARTNPPPDRVPYVFEKRVVARLKEPPPADAAALWARALWRSAAACVALAVLVGTWSLVGAGQTVASSNEEFSQHFEQTMLAAVHETEEVW